VAPGRLRHPLGDAAVGMELGSVLLAQEVTPTAFLWRYACLKGPTKRIKGLLARAAGDAVYEARLISLPQS
jgi:hypothetical protein